MRRREFVICVAALTLSASVSAAELSDPAQRVKNAYAALVKAPSERNVQLAYLAAFPADFATFLAVFMPKDFKQLYDGHDYVFALSDIGNVLPEQTFAKILKIESTAKWQADAPNYLQHVSIKLALQHPRQFVSGLGRLSPSEQNGVIEFLVDGPHRPTEDFKKLTEELKRLGYVPESKQLRQAGEKVRRGGKH